MRALSLVISKGRARLVAALRTGHPHACERELQARMVARLYGRAVSEKYFGHLDGDVDESAWSVEVEGELGERVLAALTRSA
jgi:hypothetical protein